MPSPPKTMVVALASAVAAAAEESQIPNWAQTAGSTLAYVDCTTVGTAAGSSPEPLPEIASDPPPVASAKASHEHPPKVLAPAGSALAYTVADAVLVSGLSRTRLYQLFNEGVLTPRRAGRRTLILADELRDVVRNLPPAPVRCRNLPKPT
jgi:hypothetical protein